MQVLKSRVAWDQLGALPEMLQTAYGSLYIALQLKRGDRLLIRGGTTSVLLAAAAIAHNRGVYVMSTTRKSDRAQMLKDTGADQVLQYIIVALSAGSVYFFT